MVKSILAVLSIAVLAAGSKAELADYLGLGIARVELSPTAAADSFLVLNSSGLIPGDILTADKLQNAVRRIYSLGIFADVAIFAEKSGNRVNLRIEAEPYPRLSKVKLEGNSRLSTKNLKKELTVYEDRIASPGAIKANVEKIRKLYESKGFLLAEVESSLEPDPKSGEKAILTFRINEGPKVKIKNITFSGNQVFNDDKLRSKISTKRKSFFRSGSFDSDKFREDRRKLVEFYKNEGYIDAVVLGDSIWYSADRRQMFINFRLSEGERYYFGRTSWSGNSVLSDEKIASAIKIKENRIYKQEDYDKTIAGIYEQYQNEGYWYVNIKENKSPRDHHLDLELSITENNPVYVKLINIEGNTKTKDKVIRRELKIKPETIFKRSILTRSLRDVMILNFFGNVVPDWNVLDDGNIDLIIKVEEKPTGQFSLGAGYSAQDRLVGTVGLGIPNFLGGGQTVSLDADFGSRRQTFSIGYFEPWFRDTPTSLGINAYIQDREYSGWFTESRKGGSVKVGRRLRWPDNYFRVYASYRLEQLKYFDFNSTYVSANIDNPYSVDKLKWPQQTSSMSLTVERDSRDLAQFATKGKVYAWTGELAGTALGGNWNYWKQMLLVEHYYTPYWKFTLGLKGKWGLMEGIYSGDSDVPFSERFTPGGTDPDGIIRGYSDSRVGPRSPSGGYLGGRAEAIYNLELTVPISEQQFYVLLFADAGNAYLSGREFRDNFYRHFYKSAGFGFRVVAPMIGVIGFDFGYPFDGEDKGKLRPHFQIGRGF